MIGHLQDHRTQDVPDTGQSEAYCYRSGWPASLVHAPRCSRVQQDSGRPYQPVNSYVYSANAVETGENLSSAKNIKPETTERFLPDIRRFRPVSHHRDHCA